MAGVVSNYRGGVLLRHLVLSIFFFLPVVSNAEDDMLTAESALADMSRALRELDYSGTFTFEHGGMLETLKLVHQVVDGKEVEWLEHLNGPARSLERKGLTPGCLTSSERLARGDFQSDAVAFNGLSQHYHFYLKGEQRVAGRLARVLHIVPRDAYRFGYTLFLDQKTRLPLLSMTVNHRRRVLERMQFSDLKLAADVELPGANATHIEKVSPDVCGYLLETEADWRVGWVPSGFVLTAFNEHNSKGESLSFTDGLATFSVFLQPEPQNLGYQGNAQRGASVVIIKQQEEKGRSFLVSVVGEMPLATAEKVANSVRIEASPEL